MHIPRTTLERKQAILKSKDELETSPGLPLGKIFSSEKVGQVLAESDLEYRDRIFSPSSYSVCVSLAVTQQKRLLPGGSCASFGGTPSSGVKELFFEYFQLCSRSSAFASQRFTEPYMFRGIRSPANLSDYRKMGMARPTGEDDRWQHNPGCRYSGQSQSIPSPWKAKERGWISNSASLRTDQFKHRLCM